MLAEYVTNSRIGIGNVPMETITTLSSNQLHVPVQTSLRADTTINSFRNNYL